MTRFINHYCFTDVNTHNFSKKLSVFGTKLDLMCLRQNKSFEMVFTEAFQMPTV